MALCLASLFQAKFRNFDIEIDFIYELYFLGFQGWAMYSLVGLLLAILCFREKLPLTMKSCLYPLIGDYIFGWIGDVVDVVSIMGTLFGVCTSLGIASRQVNLGLSILNPDIDPSNITIQVTVYIQD